MRLFEEGMRISVPSNCDEIQFDLADDAATLLIKIQNPTKKEQKSFRESIPFRFVVVSDIIFILVQLGGTWMDAPYYFALSKSLTRLPKLQEGLGIVIHALLVDSTTGILVGQKIFSPDTKMSMGLIDAIRSQPIIPDYYLRLQDVYSRYSTLDLLSLAQ